MLKIEYCEEGVPVSDFNYINWGDNIVREAQLERYEMYVKVSTSTPIRYILLLISRGTLDFNNVEFVFNGFHFKSDQYGRCKDWPSGFCSLPLDMTREMVKNQINKQKLNRTLL